MSLELTIDSSMVGLVIGRGGTKIKSIQNDSGAIIKILDGDLVDTHKVVVIGTDDAQKLASDLIEKITGKILQSVKCAAPQPPPRRRQRPTKDRRNQRPSSPPEQISFNQDVWDEICKENDEKERLLMESLPPIKKDFYVEHKEVKAMSVEQVQSFRLEKNNIVAEYVEGAEHLQQIPKPVITFEHAFQLYPEIMAVVRKQKFTTPSPIQCQAWPIIMSGHDLIAIAQTGTGKTLAYILPALIHLLRQPTPRKERIGPSVAILGPTRELVLQIEEEINKYIFDGICVMSLYGGVSVEHQIHGIENEKPDIIVATPGRLKELVCLAALKLDHVSYLVLDEADRMLDMGFKCQIEIALGSIRPDKQTILTSATWPLTVQKLATSFTKNPMHITVGSIDLTTVNTVEQKVIVLKERQKGPWIESFIEKISKNEKVIIFMRTKAGVDKLYEKFKNKNINCR